MSQLKVEINDTASIIKFAIIFNNLKNLFDETNMYFRESGLYLQCMDGSQICCCELCLDASWFTTYSVKKEIVIGVNLEVFDKILSCLDKKLNLKLTFSNSDKFEITMSGEHITKKYEMALIDIDSAILQIPDVNYSADIEMNSMQFKNYVNELSLFGDDLKINCDENDIILSNSSGEGNASEIVIQHKYLEEYMIEEGLELESKYNIKFVKLITNFVKLSKNIYLGISEHYPFGMFYNLDGETEEQLNTIKFYIAPKVDDED